MPNIHQAYQPTPRTTHSVISPINPSHLIAMPGGFPNFRHDPSVPNKQSSQRRPWYDISPPSSTTPRTTATESNSSKRADDQSSRQSSIFSVEKTPLLSERAAESKNTSYGEKTGGLKRRVSSLCLLTFAKLVLTM